MYNPLQKKPANERGSPRRPTLKRVLARFWSGDVRWTLDAGRDLSFCLRIDFGQLEATISVDTAEMALRSAFDNPTVVDDRGLSYVATDASGVACGGGLLRRVPGRSDSGDFSFQEKLTMVSELPSHLQSASSGLREATAILWLLRSLQHVLARRVVVFSDSRAAVAAIIRGSSNTRMQRAVRDIFTWCMLTGTSVFPCWVPRDAHVLVTADALSRVRDVYGDVTPAPVFAEANRAARRTWGRDLSFDRQATHLNVIPPSGMGAKLKFNSLWLQPGSAGVDMFIQPRASWQSEINFIHPAAPTIGRTLTFVQEIGARAVIVFPASLGLAAWWSPWSTPNGPGVVESFLAGGFRVVVVDHLHKHL